MAKYLTWEELADFYGKKTGGRARIKPMDMIYDWAIKQPEIIEDKNGLRFRKEAINDKEFKR